MALIDNCICYYKLDETAGTTAEDETGTYDGTNNGAVIDQAGKINRCYNFPDATDRINTPSMTFRSVSFWFYINNLTDKNRYYLFDARPGAGNAYVYIDPNTNHVCFGTGANGFSTLYLNTGSIANDVTEVSVGAWHHIAGVLTADKTADIHINAKNTNLEALNSQQDEIGFWSRAITTGDIGSLYNSGDGLTYPFSGGGPPPITNVPIYFHISDGLNVFTSMY